MIDQPEHACSRARAPRLPPDERREMLIAATVPLLARHGCKVTSRQISEAAGVAEGTIFRAFGDKEALIEAALDHALDPGPVLAELGAVDPALPLRERVQTLVGILQQRFVSIFGLMLAVGMHDNPDEMARRRAEAKPATAAVLAEIERQLAPDAAKFSCAVPELVRMMRLLTLAGSHPLITDGQLLSADDITSVLLDGMLGHDDSERG